MSAAQYSPKERRHHVTCWAQSGMTRRQYALQQGIAYKTFDGWARQYSPVGSPQATEGAPVPTIVPVRLTSSLCHKTPPLFVMLHLTDGCRIECQLTQLADVLTVIRHVNP